MKWKLLAEWFELAGGSRQPPSSWDRRDIALLRAGWWILLFLLIWAFAGRGTKFIYVDF
jgi:hypothetical protein